MTNNSELPSSEQRFQHYLGLAGTLPKVDPNDPRVEQYLNAEKAMNIGENTPFSGTYGNNFHILFQTYKSLDLDAPIEITLTTKLAHAIIVPRLKPIKDQWRRFVNQNETLLGEIDVALKNSSSASALEKYRYSLRDSNDKKDKVRLKKLDQIISHPIGAHAYVAAASDVLNSLLEEAAHKMRGHNIDPTVFYR